MPSALNPLPSLLRAAARDAGNDSAAAANRSRWCAEDHDAAAAKLLGLIDQLYGPGGPGLARYATAIDLERAGTLSIHTKRFFATLEEAIAAERAFPEH